MPHLRLISGMGVEVGGVLSYWVEWMDWLMMWSWVRYITDSNRIKLCRFVGTVRNGIDWDVANTTIISPTKPTYAIGPHYGRYVEVTLSS